MQIVFNAPNDLISQLQHFTNLDDLICKAIRNALPQQEEQIK